MRCCLLFCSVLWIVYAASSPANSKSVLLTRIIDTYDSSKKTLLYRAIGFNTSRRKEFLSNLLNLKEIADIDTNVDLEDDCQLLESEESDSLVQLQYIDSSSSRGSSSSSSSSSSYGIDIDIDSDNIYSDCALVFVDYHEIYNPNLLLSKFSTAIASVVGTDAISKRAMIIVISSPNREKGKLVEPNILQILSQSWSLMDKPSYMTENIATEINLKLISHIQGTKPLESEKDALVTTSQTLAENGRNVTTILNYSGNSKSSGSSSSSSSSRGSGSGSSKSKNSSSGLASHSLVVEVAVETARKLANSNLQRLQKAESASEFAGFMTNLINTAIENAESILSDTYYSTLSLLYAKKEIKRQIYTMMLPFYRRFIQLARQEVATTFNNKVGEDLAVTVDLLKDLNNAKKQAISQFQIAIGKLVPKDRSDLPSSWDTSSDIYQLELSLLEYIENRENQAKLLGVLSRGRKPIDISFHTFFNHPFGRDSRQNPLAANNNQDIIKYDPSSIDDVEQSMLPQELMFASDCDGKKQLKEFSREMLMLPLSIKNPEVPLMSGRSRRRSSPPSLDTGRSKTGPERFIRWDLEDMQPIRESINRYVKKESDNVKDMKDNLLNTIPLFKKGYYKHPEIHMDDKE
tara:strand:- start:2668 stop:4566 length:1899 start_codon:yes stop_codon:yes gene_type:complete